MNRDYLVTPRVGLPGEVGGQPYGIKWVQTCILGTRDCELVSDV